VRVVEFIGPIESIVDRLAEYLEFRLDTGDIGPDRCEVALDLDAVGAHLRHVGFEQPYIALQALDLLAKKSKVNFLGHRMPSTP
jgi:hypothetical protein